MANRITRPHVENDPACICDSCKGRRYQLWRVHHERGGEIIWEDGTWKYVAPD